MQYEDIEAMVVGFDPLGGACPETWAHACSTTFECAIRFVAGHHASATVDGQFKAVVWIAGNGDEKWAGKADTLVGAMDGCCGCCTRFGQ